MGFKRIMRSSAAGLCLLTAVTTYATNAIAQVVDPGVRRATADNTTRCRAWAPTS